MSEKSAGLRNFCPLGRIERKAAASVPRFFKKDKRELFTNKGATGIEMDAVERGSPSRVCKWKGGKSHARAKYLRNRASVSLR